MGHYPTCNKFLLAFVVFEPGFFNCVSTEQIPAIELKKYGEPDTIQNSGKFKFGLLTGAKV